MEYSSRIDLTEFNSKIAELKFAVNSIVKGQDEVLELLLTALLADGHVLLEGVPGVAKTLMAKTLSQLIGVDFKRLQFTPDLMPTDVVGTSILNTQTQEFTFRKGPVFTQFLLVDEINRAPAKTQAALFECMEERQVTFDGKTYALPDFYMVMATQNPVEFLGTYPLPEAQMDRFLMRISIGYPSEADEADILERYSMPTQPMHQVAPVCTAQDIINLQQQVKTVYCSREVRAYIVSLCAATRKVSTLTLGASTRAAIALCHAAQANALLSGRDYIIPEDVQHLYMHVLAHRLVPSAEARMANLTSEQILAGIMKQVRIPVKMR